MPHFGKWLIYYMANVDKTKYFPITFKLQYLFIFDALLEVMLSPDFQTSSDQLRTLDLVAIKKTSEREFQVWLLLLKTLCGNDLREILELEYPHCKLYCKFYSCISSYYATWTRLLYRGNRTIQIFLIWTVVTVFFMEVVNHLKSLL